MKPTIWWSRVFQTWQCSVEIYVSPVTCTRSVEYSCWAGYGRGVTIREDYENWKKSIGHVKYFHKS